MVTEVTDTQEVEAAVRSILETVDVAARELPPVEAMSFLVFVLESTIAMVEEVGPRILAIHRDAGRRHALQNPGVAVLLAEQLDEREQLLRDQLREFEERVVARVQNVQAHAAHATTELVTTLNTLQRRARRDR
jgi:hypothetical protein